MEKVLTLVKKNHEKFGGNRYVKGRISGIAFSICGFDRKRENPNTEIKDGYILQHMFTPDEYDKFINIIEELYPGLCEFNYQMKEGV